MIIRTTRKADAVLAIVDDLAPDMRLYSEPYQNGREHGWRLDNVYTPGAATAFAEYRRSDEIVVYLGKPGEFSMQGNVPGERAWKDRRMFGPEAYLEAAEVILAHLAPSPEAGAGDGQPPAPGAEAAADGGEDG